MFRSEIRRRNYGEELKVSGPFFGGIRVNQSPQGLKGTPNADRRVWEPKPIPVRDPYAASESRLFTVCQNLERESSFPSK
jgi:hypothetical protein